MCCIFPEKSRQDKDCATTTIERQFWLLQSGKPAFAFAGGEMTKTNVTDNRGRRYIRITDEDSWHMIDEISKAKEYEKSFNKIINDALFYGLPVLSEKVRGGVMEEDKRNLAQNTFRGSRLEEFNSLLIRLLREIILNVTINKSILSSLYNQKSFALTGQEIKQNFDSVFMSDTPEYISRYEIEGLKSLRK